MDASNISARTVAALFATTAALGGGQALAPAPAAAMDDPSTWLECMSVGGTPVIDWDGQERCAPSDGSGDGALGIIRVSGTAPPPPPCAVRSGCLPSVPTGGGGAGRDGDRGSGPGASKGVGRGDGSRPANAEKPARSTESLAHRFNRSQCELARRRAARVRLEDDKKLDWMSFVHRWWIGSQKSHLEWLQRQWDGMRCDEYLAGGLVPQGPR
jgi:hypothetical protein